MSRYTCILQLSATPCPLERHSAILPKVSIDVLPSPAEHRFSP
jgi:hypothetical protein